MSNTKSVFSKENSVALKGVAIMMLVFFHCLSSPERYEGYAIDFAPLGEHWVTIIASSCKMCVSIFAFVTGYGLYLSLKNLNAENKWSNRDISKWTVNRYIKLMSGFWVIAALAFVICQFIDGRTADIFFEGFSIGETVKGIIRMAVNFMGLGDYFEIRSFCKTWWYMSLAVVFVFVSPVFTKLIDKFGAVPVLVFTSVIPRIIRVPFEMNTFTTFAVIYVVGMVFAKYNLMVRLANVKWIKSDRLSRLDKPVRFAGMTLIVVFMIYLYYCFPVWMYEVRLALFPVVLIIYLYDFFLDTAVIRKVLYFFGKHSMNIFLTHTFIRAIYLEEFTYSFSKWWLIPTALFALSLLLSIVLELFKKLIRYDLLTKKMLSGAVSLIDRVFDRAEKFADVKKVIKYEKVN